MGAKVSDNILLEIDEIDFVRSTLTAVHGYLHAQDIASSYQKMMPEVRPSSLTREVAECLEVVEEAYKGFLLTERDRDRFQVDPDPTEPTVEFDDDE